MNVLKTYVSPTRMGGPAAPRGKAALVAYETSIARLVRTFWIWKACLLLVAIFSPGPGYDTSTQLLFHGSDEVYGRSWLAKALEYPIARLTRWDGIYFAAAAERGLVYEQQWAFSPVLALLTSVIGRGALPHQKTVPLLRLSMISVLFYPFTFAPILKTALTGILISHVFHLLAVRVLYKLVYELIPSTFARKSQLAFLTACLHVFSPAGLFLSAPFGESVFAFLNFMGMLTYLRATQARPSSSLNTGGQEGYWLVTSGAWFGLASLIRSNGLLSGLLFLWDVIEVLPRLKHIWKRNAVQRTRLYNTVIAGSIIGLAYVAPQFYAYVHFCTGGSTRPWCSSWPPSIYNFVQSHYWDVGLFRYWTLPNVPLFLLAGPVGWLMIITAIPAITAPRELALALKDNDKQSDKPARHYVPDEESEVMMAFQRVMPRLAVLQIVLVVLAATSFHVQILNRISSGYPVWYLGIAVGICGGGAGDRGARMFGTSKKQWIFRGMLVYAVVQGGLYASFLPPA